MTREEMTNRILAAIDWNRAITMNEAVDAIGTDAKGDLAMEIKPNVIIWSGMSEDFIRTIATLMEAHVIEIAPTSALFYYASGAALRLPVVKQARRRYARPSWLPIVLRRPTYN